jgi:hypothetical protein
VQGGEKAADRDLDLPKRRKSIVNVWTILAIVVFYFAYVSYVRADVRTAAVFVVVALLFVYLGLSGGTKYEF